MNNSLFLFSSLYLSIFHNAFVDMIYGVLFATTFQVLTLYWFKIFFNIYSFCWSWRGPTYYRGQIAKVGSFLPPCGSPFLTQVIRLRSKCLYLLSHFTGPLTMHYNAGKGHLHLSNEANFVFIRFQRDGALAKRM